jgi:hypothetical protein
MNLAITGTKRRNVELDAEFIVAAVHNARERVGDDGRWSRAIDKAAVWIVGQDALVYDGDTSELIGVGSATSDRVYSPSPLSCQCEAFAKSSPCWHRAAALLVKWAAGLKAKEQLEDVAVRLAAWQERGWVPQSMDIVELKGGERFADWRDVQGRRWTADLAANENYVVLPLHCRELGQLANESLVLTPRRLERARVWIADMVEFI